MKLLILTGKCCAGKTSLIRYFAEKGYRKVITTTTRSPREGEVHGVDYNFVSKIEFEHMIMKDKLVEYTLRGSTYYGIPKSELNRNDKVLAIVNPEGVVALKKYTLGKCLAIYVDARGKERELRALYKRGMTDEEWEAIRIVDEREFQDIYSKVDITVDNPFNCLFELEKIMKEFSSSRGHRETAKCGTV